MSDLKDRQAAIEACKKIQQSFTGVYNDPDSAEYIGECISELGKLPSAQPAERCVATIRLDEELLKEVVDKAIIRCKDCSYWDSDWCDRHGGTMEKDDFCSRAERRADE